MKKRMKQRILAVLLMMGMLISLVGCAGGETGDKEPEQENDPEALYFGKEYTEAFVEQLKEMLSPLENHVLYLHLMGTDYKKIAEILEKSPKSVDNAIQRIRGKAEKMLRRGD